jgi:hypothetical protein
MPPGSTSRTHSTTHLQNNPGANCLLQSRHAVSCNAEHTTTISTCGWADAEWPRACMLPTCNDTAAKRGSQVLQAEERTDTEKHAHYLTLFALVHHQALHVVCFQDATVCSQLVDTELPNRCTVHTVLNCNTCTELQLLRCTVKRPR